MKNATSIPWRELRQGTGLSLREVSRRTGINSGRLSVIERGVVPNDIESTSLMRVLADAVEDTAITSLSWKSYLDGITEAGS
jgi:transcriptional regulator with XRE-family HTH domain